MAAKPAVPEPEPIERWTAQRKAAIIIEVMKGQISVPEAARKYGLTQNEYRRRAKEYHRAGVEALKVNRRDQNAKYEAEIKRLRAKIGQLVIDENRCIPIAAAISPKTSRMSLSALFCAVYVPLSIRASSSHSIGVTIESCGLPASEYGSELKWPTAFVVTARCTRLPRSAGSRASVSRSGCCSTARLQNACSHSRTASYSGMSPNGTKSAAPS